MLIVKGMRFPIEVILVCIRWYAAYPLSLSAPGRNDGGAWCICGSFYSEPLGDPIFTITGKDFQKINNHAYKTWFEFGLEGRNQQNPEVPC